MNALTCTSEVVFTLGDTSCFNQHPSMDALELEIRFCACRCRRSLLDGTVMLSLCTTSFVFMFDGPCLGSVQEIHKHLEKISAIDHTAYDAFILAILSHGNQDVVYGMDGVKDNRSTGFLFLDEITSLFDGTNCRSLNSKPKMFLIQACQGGERTN